MEKRYIKPELVIEQAELEDIIAMSLVDETSADPTKPTLGKEREDEKDAWNEGLW